MIDEFCFWGEKGVEEGEDVDEKVVVYDLDTRSGFLHIYIVDDAFERGGVDEDDDFDFGRGVRDGGGWKAGFDGYVGADAD